MLTLTQLNQYCTLASPSRPEIWKCNTLVVDHGAYLSLIDGNLNPPEIDHLENLFDKPIKTCFSTHSHIDHINHLHCLEKRRIPIFSPEAEHKYLLNIDLLLQAGGADKQSARAEMSKFIIDELGFKALTKVTAFVPETVFADGEIDLQSIPLPGHSPGHTGYLITTPDETDILFVADIGLDDFGAWYGFAYCNLTDYRASIRKLKNIYNPEQHILVSSHNRPHFPDAPGKFDPILNGMIATEEKILQALNKNDGQTVADLTFTGLYYPLRALKRMRGGLRKLYSFWEFYCIQNHLLDLQERQRVYRDNDGRWYLQK